MLDYVEPRMTNLLALKYPFLVDLEKSVPDDLYTNRGGSAYLVFEPIETRIPQGHADIARGGAFGDAHPSAGDRAQFELMIQTLKIVLDESVLDQAGAQPKMVLNYLGNEMRKAMTSFRLRVDGILHHGANGVIATTTGAYAAGPPKTFAVDSYDILADMIGMVMDVNDKVSGATNHADGITLTGIDRANSYVEFTGTGANVISGDAVMLENPVLTAGSPVCQFGINDMISNADVVLVDTDDTYDFGNIDRTSGGNYWKGEVLDAGNERFTFDLLQRAVDQVSDRSGASLDRLYMKENMRREFLKHFAHLYPGMTPTVKKLSPGYSIIQYEAGDKTLGIAVDKKTASGEITGLTLDTVKIRHAKPIGWRTRGGGPIYVDLDNYRCEAVILYQWQLTGNNPGANIRVHNINVS